MDKTAAFRRVARANRLLADMGYADILDALEELKRIKAQPAQQALDAYCIRKIEEALNPTGMRLNDGKARIDIGILSRLYKLAQQAQPADAQDAARYRKYREFWLSDEDHSAKFITALTINDFDAAVDAIDAIDAQPAVK